MSRLEFTCRLRYPDGFLLDAAFTTNGGVTALFGPSGSGKTSILSVIAGLRRPDAGRVQLGERVLFDHRARINLAPEARRVGYVFQESLLFPHLTVRQNLLYGWRRKPAGTHVIELRQVVEVLELEQFLERSPHSLSGGQRQRVALGRALLSGPELLLLDEPVGSLDAPLKERVLDHLAQLFGDWKVPTLYVTHTESEVNRLAQRVIVLERGRVTAAGAPAEIFGRIRTEGGEVS